MGVKLFILELIGLALAIRLCVFLMFEFGITAGFALTIGVAIFYAEFFSIASKRLS